eukprot:CAMPEP_0119011056 /NCGR_PEP_ID=MMETSP1176-20130426/5420_1 /TAXON_ID=265551 /ORGANISM="Synedropsis recta cf, Strain CCMP1620" /LENGTH=574 /DNA_ID=CAMNT_0006963817 /DNA_START=17 /DNA_END=1740 /DNA_ORIENTATION=+
MTSFLLQLAFVNILSLSSLLVLALNLNEIALYDNSGFENLKVTLDLADAPTPQQVIYIGDAINDKMSSVKWKIETGKYATLLKHLGSSSERHKIQGLDLVGTGGVQTCSYNSCVDSHDFNDVVSAYYWGLYDTSIGYFKLFEHKDFEGVRKFIFLSEFSEDTIISMGDWNIQDEVTSLKWGNIGENIEVELFEDADGEGLSRTITGSMSETEYSNLSDHQLNDKISAFRWSRTPTPSPTPIPSPAPTQGPTPEPISSADTCEANTELLMEGIHSEYNDSKMTETQIREGEFFVDFSTNSDYNTLYAAACRGGHEYEDASGDTVQIEGNYQELHYVATCHNADLNVAETMTVSGHPRCYASTCGPEDQATLLEDLSIELMQNRANDREANIGTWTCEGEESQVQYSGLCDFETDTLNGVEDLKLAQVALKPSIDTKMFLWIIPTGEQVVTFGATSSSNSAYETSCSENGGTFSDMDIKALCTEDEETELDLAIPYTIEGYPICLATSCQTAEVDAGTATVAAFVSMMKIQEKFGAAMSCEVSAAIGSLSVGVYTGLADEPFHVVVNAAPVAAEIE